MSANQLVTDPRLMIGGNQPPLEAQLDELLEPLKKRQGELVGSALAVRIIDQESARKAMDLDRMMKTLSDDLKRVRETVKRPWLEGCRLVDRRVNAYADPLQREHGKVRQAIDAYRRMLEEQAKGEPEPPPPLRSDLGTLGTQRRKTLTITDLRKLLGWMLKQKGMLAGIEEAARVIMFRYLRGLSLEAVERGLEIPGAEVTVEKMTAVR
jgi:hypothetical protein